MYKHFLRMCSLLLTLVMLIHMLPAGISAEELLATQSGTLDSTQASDEDVHIVAEVTDKRTEYSKEYLLSNGLHMATVYNHAVHYEKNGQWTDIDNTLRSVGEGTQAAYANTEGIWDVSFPQQLSTDKGVSITKDGYTLTFYMSGELRAPSGGNLSTEQMGTASFAMTEAAVATAEIQNIDLSKTKAEAEHPETIQEELHSRLQYADVFADTNIVYDLASNQLKESIVMERYSSTLQGYQYILNTGGMTPVLSENGQIELFGKDSKEPVMVMPAPYLLDSADAFCGDVTVELVEKGDQYILFYVLPQEWLADEERQWPVILDPVVSATASVTNIKDQCVFSDGTSDPQSTVLDCGYGGYGTGAMRIYLQYVELPELTSADVIVEAVVQLYKVYDYGHTDPISVHKVLDTWDSMTMQWSNKAPAQEGIAEDFTVCKDVGFYTWNVTDIVRGWYEGENTGMMFKNTDDVETNSTYYHYQRFRSSDYSIYDTETKPTLSIVFRNNNGLESYWDYTSASAGRAGTGYVNNYTGNLVWIRGDLGYGGCVMPVSISHVYNANDSKDNDFGLGNGWRTNYNQRVYQWVHPNAATTYYVWEDADGTAHYFLQDGTNGWYVDEDGLELKLTVKSDGTYTLQDKNGNTSYFDTNGRLTKQENNQATESSINITYVSTSKRISTITDSAGRVYAFDYNSSNLLTSIKYKGSGSDPLTQVTFGYSGTRLASITDEDGKVSTYTYKNTNDTSKNLLETAKDIDGYTLTYTYTSLAAGQPARVASVSEKYGTTAGGSLTIEYAKNQTTFTDHNGNVQIMQFNNLGNTVSVQDDEGRAQYARYAINNTAVPTDTAAAAETAGTAKANQLTLSSKLQNTVGNVLPEGSFEESGLWTATSSAVTVSRASGTAYMGSKSMKLVRGASGTAAGAYSGSFPVAAGETYTFSAWVKTGNGPAYLALHDGSKTVTSEVLAKNQGWTRLQVSYTATAAKTLTARVLTAEAGTLYVDCVQVEKAPTASRYNLIENGDFRGTNGWSASTGRTTLTAAAPELSTNVYTMTGVYNAQNRLSQTVKVSGAANDVFVLAGWAKGDSVPLDSSGTNTREFSLIATFNNTDGTTSTSKIRFNPYTDSSVNWQYAAAPIVAEKAYSSITVELAYDYNMNTVYFDGIQLFKERFGSSYTYDDNGNVKSVTDIQGEKTTYEYTNNNLTKATLPTGAVLTYTYDSYHNVKTATTATGVVYSFGYDSKGNNTSVSITSGGVTLTSTAEYSGTGLLLSTTDAAGNKTEYGYNANNNELEWVKYPKDTDATRTNYTYDDMHRIATAAVTTDSGAAMSVAYTYSNDLLTKIATPTTTYNFTYGSFGLRSDIRVGTQLLAWYGYTSDKNFYLNEVAYANGDVVQYSYDDHGRIILQHYSNGDKVTYQYDNSGALATVTDSATGIKTTYYYDFADRMMKYVESGTNYSHSVGYAYDEINNLTSLVETINGTAHTTSYTYDNDNRVTSITNGSASETYTYDGYSRVSQKVTKNGTATVLTDTFTYRTPTTGTTSGQVSTLKLAASGLNRTYTYAYDNNGNILSVSDGTNTTSYVYDSAGQLLRENNQAAGKTWVWTYDNAGNIKTRKEYAYTTGTLGTVVDTVTYTYGNSNWGDLLTSYDGQTITYDNIGNPLDDGTWEYTWEHGRQLASMTDGSTTWTYTYNADGLRAKRTNGTTTYNYIYNGSSLTQMTVGSDTLYFAYDGSSPMAVTYNGTNYYYATNLQGDVIAILNSSGTAVVQYTYDAWGNILTTTGSMASTLGAVNPLTYRGYVFDRETQLYYLQSRYYNPEIGRFINADVAASTGQGILGNNMFAYCGNNPVNRTDASGQDWWHWALAAAIVVAAAAAVVVTAGGATAAIVAVTCVANGVAASTTAATVAAGVFIGSSAALAVSAYSAAIESESLDDFAAYGESAMYTTAIGGALGGAVAYGMDRAQNKPQMQELSACFVAGTLVKTANENKPIENIQVGDLVWAWDEETGEVALKEVVETYVNETNELVHVFVNGEEIIATPSHPFYSPVKGWTAAVHLRAGDILVLVNGEYVVVEKIQHEILEAPIAVYNFQVADYHTYYVAGTGVLVHNKCGGNATDLESISTGRTEPNNLLEQLAMESAKSNPAGGKEILTHLNDSRFPSDFSKFQQTFDTSIGRIVIHYVGNIGRNIYYDFKFK